MQLLRENSEHRTAVRELLQEAKRLAARYYALTGKPLGVTGEVAELEAAENLDLVLADARNPSFDAHQTRDGVVERFQIKGRVVDSGDRYRGRVPSINYNGDFEWVLLVLLDRSTYSAVEIWQASRRDVQARLEAPGSKARNERNSMAISQFLSIGRRAWPQSSTRVHVSSRAKTSLNKVSRAEAIRCGNLRCQSGAMHDRNTRFANMNAGKDVWWLDIPRILITAPSFEYVNLLLCDQRSVEPEFHHLKVPISYLAERLDQFRHRTAEDKISLELSTERVKLFQDVIGPGKIQFIQFRHCSFSESPET